MKTALVLTQLESRDTPAVFDPTFYAANFEPIPGWTGVVVVADGDFDDDGSVDRAYAAGEGGAPRVVVYSGGRLGESEVFAGDPGPQARPGEVITQPAGAGRVIFNEFVFEESFRGGADITTIVRPDGPDALVFTPGPGGGSRVRIVTLDGEIDRSFLAFDDPNYRGGVFATYTTVSFEVPAPPHQYGQHLIVMPRAGGGPVVAAFTVEGQELTRFLVGPETDRRGYELLHADVDVGEPGSGRRGVYVVTPEGDTLAFDWRGKEFTR